MAVSEAARKVLDAERAAREAEGIFEPTTEQKTLLKRRARLVERKAALQAEIDAIENSIEQDMRVNGKRALAVDGKNLALIIPVTKGVTVIDEDRLNADLPKEIVEAYRQYVAEIPKYTTTHREQNGDRVNYR